MLAVVGAPVGDQLLNLAVEVVRRQLKRPGRWHLRRAPALASSGGGSVALRRGRRRGGALVIPGVKAGGRARIGPAGAPRGGRQLRRRDSEGENDECARQKRDQGTRQCATTVLTVGVLVLDRPKPSGQGERTGKQAGPREDDPQACGWGNEGRVAARQ